MLQNINPLNETPLGLYVHWPFCLSKCPYCDFNSHVSDSIDIDAFRESYRRELNYFAGQISKRPLHSIFFGGGTPSLMPADLVEDIISHADKLFGLEQGCEITLEANPTSYETNKFKDFNAAGINRVSIGVQSLHEKDLKFLGRQHSADEAIKAIKSAQNIFDRLSFDLIYARPDQSINAWQDELKRAIDFGTSHLSLYQLTIEQGTAFHTQYNRGDFSIPNEGLAADLYEATQEITNAVGLPSYETSNHAALGEESRHNLIYWRYDDYIGIGPGAHGRYKDSHGQKWASRTHLAPQKWLERCTEYGHGTHPLEKIDNEMQFSEAIMMGLRLKQGLNLNTISQKTQSPWQDIIDEKKLIMLEKEDLIQIDDDKQIRATESGALCINALVSMLLT